MGIFSNSSKFSDQRAPVESRKASTSLRQDLSRMFTPSSRTEGQVVSVTRRPSQGVNSRTSRALIAQKKTESATKNARLEATMKAQRTKQAAMMKKARDQMSKTGAARRQQITETGVKRQAAGTQSLVSRGLGNTTIQGSMTRGVQADTDRAMTGQRDLEAGRMSDLYSREAGMQTSQGQFQLQGESMMSGGLEEYIALLQQLGGGLS